MKGIYLTPEGKKEIEAKIAELDKCIEDLKDEIMKDYFIGKKTLLEEILSSATILPVEESWNLSVVAITPFKQGLLKTLYKNGVIIKSKQ
jgi:hypothetical protein